MDHGTKVWMEAPDAPNRPLGWGERSQSGNLKPEDTGVGTERQWRQVLGQARDQGFLSQAEEEDGQEVKHQGSQYARPLADFSLRQGHLAAGPQDSLNPLTTPPPPGAATSRWGTLLTPLQSGHTSWFTGQYCRLHENVSPD